MTIEPRSPAASTPRRPEGHRREGLLLLCAGVTQLVGATTFLVPSVEGVLPPIVQVAAWGLGGVLLFAAGLVLATAGHLASTRPTALGRIAALVFGASGLLDLLVVFVALTSAGGRGISVAVIVIEHVIVLTASVITATRTICTTSLTPISRYALIPVVLVDAVALVLTATSATGELFLLSAYVLRPAPLAAAGARYALSDSRPHTPAAHH